MLWLLKKRLFGLVHKGGAGVGGKGNVWCAERVGLSLIGFALMGSERPRIFLACVKMESATIDIDLYTLNTTGLSHVTCEMVTFVKF